ncbi:MAG TPA: AAA family ATPase [Solirubrobacterales bacterium]|jgi:DNA-binding CsgD family transcriptional regulator|nr:AAA family ATPase [Solirubrobacterales bacterium]
MATALVGRDGELEFLTARLAEAEGGAARFAAVEGDPGMGKTRLLRELAERAGGRGCVVLHGRAAEFEREMPFGLFVDALDSFLEAAPGSAFGALDQEQVDELASAFPAMRPLASGDSPAPAPEDRIRVYGAVRELLGCLAPGKTVLITLDDLHWSDRASLELIGHLLRRPPRARVMLAFSYRSRRLDSSAMSELRAAADAGNLGLQRLGPLDPMAAGALLDGNPRAAEIVAQGGGNPFYLLELSRAEHVADPVRGGGRIEGVPEAIAIAIDRELGALSANGRALANASAVVGDPFSLDLSIGAAGLDPGDGLTALDELAASDLVRATDVPRRFQFRHPLVRAAVYDAVPEGTRLAIHALCAELLRDGREGLSVRAHHVEQSAQFGDSEAVEVLREAALGSAARAPASAVRWLRAALRLLPDDAPVELRQELLMPLPGLLTSLSDFNGAYEATLEALASVTPDQRDLQVALTIGCASFEHALGDRDRAGARLDGALEEALAEGSPDAVALLIAKLMDRFYDRRFEEMPEWGERAVAAAASIDNRPLRAAAAGAHLMGCALGGRVEEAQRNRPEVIDLIDELSDEELAERLDAIGCLAAAEMYLDEFADVVAHGKRGIEVGRASGRAAFAPTLVPCVGTCGWVLGDIDLSLEILSTAAEAARVSRNQLQLAWSLLNLAFAQAVQGDVEGAKASGEEATGIAAELGDSAISSWAGLCLGIALREAGEHERATETFTSMMGGSGAHQIPGGWRAHAAMELTRAAVGAGQLELADESRRHADEAARETGLPMARAWADRAEAEVLLARGESEAAAELALSAAAGAGELNARIDRAVSRELAGRALLAASNEEAATEQFALAAEEFDECKAYRHRDRVEQALGRLGHRTSRRSRPAAEGAGLESLTGREKEVAQLLVERLTNAEIAEKLFLSEKTVESHLRNIFRKLDVGSRVEVAKLVEAARPEI